jgi:hypothetical protein
MTAEVFGHGLQDPNGGRIHRLCLCPNRGGDGRRQCEHPEHAQCGCYLEI